MRKIMMSAVLLFGFSAGAMEPHGGRPYSERVQTVISSLTDYSKKITVVSSCQFSTQDLVHLSSYSSPDGCAFFQIEGGELDLDKGIVCYSIKVGYKYSAKKCIP